MGCFMLVDPQYNWVVASTRHDMTTNGVVEFCNVRN
jgi:hypothetical protein